MHRTDPQTGNVITTKIELDDELIADPNLQAQEINDSSADREYEMSLAESQYYYDCSMPMPPIIEKPIDRYEERQLPPTPSPGSILNSALAGFNSIGLNILSFGFTIYNVLAP